MKNYHGRKILLYMSSCLLIYAQEVCAKSEIYFEKEQETHLSERGKIASIQKLSDLICGNYIINKLIDSQVKNKKGFEEDGYKYRIFYNEHAAVYWNGFWRKQAPPPTGSWLVREVEIKDIGYFPSLSFLNNASPQFLIEKFGNSKIKSNKYIEIEAESSVIKFGIFKNKVKTINADCRGSQ